MGKLRVFSGDELCRLIEQHGYQQVRQRGSHAVRQRRTVQTTITVPIPLHAELHIGTLQSIIRQTGLPRSIFEVE